MGRPYADELAELPRTYAAARHMDVAPFLAALRQIGPRPMVYVGSGGSYSVAVHLQQLHERRASAVARAMTPLELIDADGLGGISVCLISANGSHPDILSALRHAASRRPDPLIVFCATPETPLARLAREIEGAIVVELDLRPRIDGFLATNSLLAMTLVGGRAYDGLAAEPEHWPDTLDAFLERSLGGGIGHVRHALGANGLTTRERIHVLVSPLLKPAAVDLESRFAEGALGLVRVADLRNFAHGRYMALAQDGSTAGIIALVGERFHDLATRTLAVLPSAIPKLRIDCRGTESWQQVAGLIVSIQLAGHVAEARGCDPGRPKVPVYGRRLFAIRTEP